MSETQVSVRDLEQRSWYARYYGKAGANRNDLRLNRGVLFQTLASERPFVRAFRQIGAEPSGLRALALDADRVRPGTSSSGWE